MPSKKLATLTCLTLCFATPAGTQDLAVRVADGLASTMDGRTGGTVQITFFPEWSGRAGSGLFARWLTQQGEGDRLCLNSLPRAAAGCVQLTKTAIGYSGQREDGSTLNLWGEAGSTGHEMPPKTASKNASISCSASSFQVAEPEVDPNSAAAITGESRTLTWS